MSLTLLVILGLAGIILLLRNPAQPGTQVPPADGDASTLEELARAGSDLSRPHQIEFFLYLPGKAAAEAVALELRAQGFQVEVQQSEDPADWLCLATREMRPELGALRSWRERLTAMAESRNGVYDGWGTEVLD